MLDMLHSNLISVIVTTKDRPGNLKKCLDCIACQSMLPKELIIVNDGGFSISPIVGQYKKIVPFEIKLIELELPVGVSVARNLGIQAATGEYVSFCDDDDEFLPEKISTIHNYIVRELYPDLIFHRIRSVYIDEQITICSNQQMPKQLSNEILITNFIGGVSRVICKRTLIENVGLFDENLKSLEDWDLWIRSILNNAKVEFCNEILVNYTIATSKESLSRDINLFEYCYKYLTKKYVKELSKLSSSELRRRIENEQRTRFRIRALARSTAPQLIRYTTREFTDNPSINTLLLLFLSFFSLKNMLRLVSWIK